MHFNCGRIINLREGRKERKREGEDLEVKE